MFGEDGYSEALSGIYAKLLVALGIALPVTEVLSSRVSPTFHQAFFMYLYLGSILFICFMHATLLKEKVMGSNVHTVQYGSSVQQRKRNNSTLRYGSFYLRVGAIAFGIGSMVYSGLEFGLYFELERGSACDNILQALTPAARLFLTIVQMQFIFINSRGLLMNQYKVVSRFGLMHMIATNVCEWLSVVIQETKHEIIHLNHRDLGELSTIQGGNASVISMPEISDHTHSNIELSNISSREIIDCRRTQIMGPLIQNASAFLFPCTVEYSLICAVILLEMWKHIVDLKKSWKYMSQSGSDAHLSPNVSQVSDYDHSRTRFEESHQRGVRTKQSHHFSVDCQSIHKGLFTGIVTLVATMICLILYYVLHQDIEYSAMAGFVINVCETSLYCVSTVAVLKCILDMRHMKYLGKSGSRGRRLGLDCSLLVIAQTGMYIYCLFSIIGYWFTSGDNATSGLITELFSLIQTTIQTIFVLDGWLRRCNTKAQKKTKPGRQIVTFLLLANMAMWMINTLQKGHADSHPSHIMFFGIWTWAIITHLAMPLAIYYRFHSTICLFEIWKIVYK